MPDFAQKRCDIKTISYLMDADELGNRKYLYQKEDDDFVLDEVLVEG